MKSNIYILLSLFITFSSLTMAQEGALDPSFGDDGIVLTNEAGIGSANTAMTLQPDGKIIVVGAAFVSGFPMAVTRYNTDGTLDTTFSNDGIAYAPFGNIESIGWAVAVTDDGKIVVTGRHFDQLSNGNQQVKSGTARFNSDGTLDNTFSGDGLTINDFSPNQHNEGRSIAIQSDNKIIVGGYSHNTAGVVVQTLVRFNENGSLDSSFNGNGVVKMQAGDADSYIYDTIVQSDGKLLTAGSRGVDGNADFTIVRYIADGTLDTSFGTNGIVMTDFGNNTIDSAFDIALQFDGKIVATGLTRISTNTDWDLAVVRYNEDGSKDTSFGTNGIVVVDIEGNRDDFTRAVAIQDDGKIVISAIHASAMNNIRQFTLLRLLSDGSVDVNSGRNGRIITPLKADNSFYSSNLEIQEDQKIVIAGTHYNDEGDAFQIVIRYLPELTLGTINFSEINESVLVYPNPIETSTTLEYELLNSESLSLKLYDVSGKLIKTFFENNDQEIGAHSKTLNFEGLSAGNYLLKLDNGISTTTVKIIKK